MRARTPKPNRDKPVELCGRCKHEARVRTYHDLAGGAAERYSVQCRMCGHEGPLAKTREEAIDLWNETARHISSQNEVG